MGELTDAGEVIDFVRCRSGDVCLWHGADRQR
jgi:hypothetical protein